jgi:LAS superfamily LD-carboxypeptidase LdcB
MVAILVLLACTGGGYAYAKVYKEKRQLSTDKANLEVSLHSTQASLQHAEENNVSLAKGLEEAQTVNTNLLLKLQGEQDKNAVFDAQIKQISGAVGTLKKLSETDKELLTKYSKVYFLSENYIPSKLSQIDPAYLLNKNSTEQIHGDVAPFLNRMLTEAKNAGMELDVVSGYRSFAEQKAVKTGYKILYGSGANQFSADQGYSEHQLGSTVDLASPVLPSLSLQLEKRPEYQWLQDNAYRFGFVLSYPKGNTFYQFEPWHWRFVGVTLATRLHSEGKHFYDLTQREIDVYLISIFD